MAVSKQENWMLTGGEDGLRLLDLENNQCVLSDDSAEVSCLALSMDEKKAISGSRDGSLSMWSNEAFDQENA